MKYSSLQLASPLWKHTCHMGQTVLPATWQKWHSGLYPSKCGTWFSNPGGMQGWADLVGWLHTHTHTRVTALFPAGTRKVNQSGFYWSKRQWVAVASAGPYASLHLAPDRWPCQNPTTQFFTGRMPFLSPNQQRQSTEVKAGYILRLYICPKMVIRRSTNRIDVQ